MALRLLTVTAPGSGSVGASGARAAGTRLVWSWGCGPPRLGVVGVAQTTSAEDEDAAAPRKMSPTLTTWLPDSAAKSANRSPAGAARPADPMTGEEPGGCPAPAAAEVEVVAPPRTAAGGVGRGLRAAPEESGRSLCAEKKAVSSSGRSSRSGDRPGDECRPAGAPGEASGGAPAQATRSSEARS